MNLKVIESSDYIVYVDESGDHSLTSIDEKYPIFVLTFCIFQKKHYCYEVTPEMRMLKFNTFGHDMVILHEHDIRKKNGHFKFLNKDARESFLEELNGLISKVDFTLISTVIDKRRLKKQETKAPNIYHLAMRLGLEKLYELFHDLNQANRLTHIICEARGQKEDRELELEFLQVCSGQNKYEVFFPFDIVVADKKTNSEGLQFADMAARPIGLSTFRPNQPNRAYKILEKKLYRNASGITKNHGLLTYP